MSEQNPGGRASVRATRGSDEGSPPPPFSSPFSAVLLASPGQSTGSQPGDVAEVGQLFDIVAADGLDESPQGQLEVLGDLGVLLDDVVLVPAVLGLAEELRRTAARPGRSRPGRSGARGGSGSRTPRRPSRGRRSRGPWSARRGSRGAGRGRGRRLVAHRRQTQGRERSSAAGRPSARAPGAGSRRAGRPASGRSAGV